MTPSVSVVLTTYNGATRGFLGEAIDSVLAQSDPDFELLIVDDGSTDGTEEFCRAYSADQRVRYIKKTNGGIASARNAGIREARAELICFLDDDDVWVPEKLALQKKAYVATSPRPALVYSAIEVTDERGKVKDMQFHPVPSEPYHALFFENFVDATSGVMVTAEALRDVGAFREDVFTGPLHGCEDRELWVRIARKYSFVAIRQPLVRYRMHGVKLSTTADTMEKGELAMLEIALESAPSNIAAEKDAIYRSVYSRFAYNRFTTGDNDAFARHFNSARRFGKVSAGLWARYALSIFPSAIPLLRRILAAMRFRQKESSGK
jgi:glycosyltransferase involved in cell wall biosynthesis